MSKLFIILFSILLMGCGNTQAAKKEQLILEVNPDLLVPPKELLKL
jgi:hypothetical protein